MAFFDLLTNDEAIAYKINHVLARRYQELLRIEVYLINSLKQYGLIDHSVWIEQAEQMAAVMIRD